MTIKVVKKNLLRFLIIKLLLNILILGIFYVVIYLILFYKLDNSNIIISILIVFSFNIVKILSIEILTSKKFSILKFIDIIKIDHINNHIILNDEYAKIRLANKFDYLFSPILILLIYFIFSDFFLNNVLFTILLYYLFIIILYLILLIKFKIIFIFKDSDKCLIIKKNSIIRKIFHIKHKWKIMINQVENIIFSKKIGLIFKLKDNKKFTVKLSNSREKTLMELSETLLSKIE